jgi:hypothetical protein
MLAECVHRPYCIVMPDECPIVGHCCNSWRSIIGGFLGACHPQAGGRCEGYTVGVLKSTGAVNSANIILLFFNPLAAAAAGVGAYAV